MPPGKLKMSQVIDLLLLDKESQGLSPRTLENYRHILRRFQRQVGDIYPRSLEPYHFTQYFAARPKGPGIQVDHSVMREFTRWCVANGHMGRFDNPMEGRKAPTSMPRQRRRLHFSLFSELLDSAERTHPRDRMVVGLGIYLFLRASEMQDLRIRDVDLNSGFIDVRITKVHQVDQMPISLELDRELRRWLTYYTEHCGPLQDDWYLVPGYDMRKTQWSGGYGRTLVPTRMADRRRLATAVQRALKGLGWDLQTEAKDPLREGVHTLRRSGARALFDTLVDQSYDGALRRVQAMLHHADSKMTERYLGIEIDRQHRNELIRGVAMFPASEGVTRLRVSG
jgi:integrase